MLARTRPNSAKLGQASAKIGPDSNKFGTISTACGPDSAEYGPKSATFGLNSTDVSPETAKLGRNQRNSTTSVPDQSRPNSANFGPKLVKLRPHLARVRPTLAPFQSTLGHRAVSAAPSQGTPTAAVVARCASRLARSLFSDIPRSVALVVRGWQPHVSSTCLGTAVLCCLLVSLARLLSLLHLYPPLKRSGDCWMSTLH